MTSKKQQDQLSNDKASSSLDISNWGLFPSLSEKIDLLAILKWWFIQYNPLYFFSAFFILTGIVFITSATGANQTTEFVLFAIIQTYELMLIGAAWLLVHKMEQIRPAILLVLLELVFLFDCTFRLETIAGYGVPGHWISMTWVILSGLKVWAILKALKISHGVFLPIVTSIAAAGIVAMLYFLTETSADKLSVLQMTGWLGTMLIVLIRLRNPDLSSSLVVTEQDKIFSQRIIYSTFSLLAGFYCYHLISYSLWIFSTPILAVLTHCGTIFFAFALFREKESQVFGFAMTAYIISLSNPAIFFSISLLLTALFAYSAMRRNMSLLAIAAAFSLHIALWSMGAALNEVPPWPGILSFPSLIFISLLILIGWQLKLTLAWVILGLGATYKIITLDFSWLYQAWIWLKEFLPTSRLALGFTFLGLGFIALIFGLGINWWLRREPGQSRELSTNTTSSLKR